MPEERVVGKRIVLEHANGMMQILGWVPDQPADYIGPEAGVTINGQPVALNLITSKRTYHLYRRLMLPGVPTFDPRQR